MHKPSERQTILLRLQVFFTPIRFGWRKVFDGGFENFSKVTLFNDSGRSKCSGWKNNSYQRSFKNAMFALHFNSKEFLLFRSRKPRQIKCKKKKNEQRSMFKFGQIKSWGRGEWRDRPINHVFFTVVFSLAFHSVITFLEQQYGHFRLGFAMYSYTASLCKWHVMSTWSRQSACLFEFTKLCNMSPISPLSL